MLEVINILLASEGAFITRSPPEIQVKDLGMKVEVFDPSGNNIEHTGQPGELVCTRPHPSLPIAFWGDESGQKLRDAYFSTYPGLWHDVSRSLVLSDGLEIYRYLETG